MRWVERAPSDEALQLRKSLCRRPPTFALAAFGAREPAVCFCRSEQASIAVAAIDILAELARTIRRHRTGLQRQAWCFAHQNAPSRSVLRGRAALDARRERDRAEIATGVRSLRSRNWRGFLRGVLARSRAKQPSQYFDHDGVSVIDLATVNSHSQIESKFCCRSSRASLTYVTLDVAHYHRQEQCHRQTVIADRHG
jgi:hypothetical protein